MPAPAHQTTAWLAFAGSVAAAWLFSTYGWNLGWYTAGMLVCLVINMLAGAWVLGTSRRNINTVGLLGLGFVIGNIALLEIATMVTLWKINGFAP